MLSTSAPFEESHTVDEDDQLVDVDLNGEGEGDDPYHEDDPQHYVQHARMHPDLVEDDANIAKQDLSTSISSTPLSILKLVSTPPPPSQSNRSRRSLLNSSGAGSSAGAKGRRRITSVSPSINGIGDRKRFHQGSDGAGSSVSGRMTPRRYDADESLMSNPVGNNDDGPESNAQQQKLLSEENFNLKMRIFYLEQELSESRRQSGGEGINSSVNSSMRHDHRDEFFGTDDLQSLKEQILQLRDENEQKDQELEERDELILRYEANAASLKQDIDVLNVELTAKQDQNDVLMQQIEQMDHDHAEEVRLLNNEVRELRNKEAALISENRRLQESRIGSSPGYSHFGHAREVEELKAAIHSRDSEISNLRDRLLTSTSSYSFSTPIGSMPGSAASIAIAEASIAELKRQIASLQEQNAELRNAKMMLEASSVASIRASSLNTSSSSSFISAATASAAAAVAFDEERRVFERRIQNANETIQDAIAKVEKSNRTIHELERKVRDADNRSSEYEYAYKDLKRQMEQTLHQQRLKNEEWERKYESLDQSCRDRVKEAESVLVVSEREWKSKIQSLNDELEEKSRQLASSLSGTPFRTPSRNAQVMQQQQHQNAEGDGELMAENRALRIKCEKFENEHRKAVQECQAHKVRAKVLEEELRVLQGEIDSLKNRSSRKARLPNHLVQAVYDVIGMVDDLIRRTDANMDAFLRITEISRQKISVSALQTIRDEVSMLLEANVKVGTQLRSLQDGLSSTLGNATEPSDGGAGSSS